jgi:hypothetical protein
MLSSRMGMWQTVVFPLGRWTTSRTRGTVRWIGW